MLLNRLLAATLFIQILQASHVHAQTYQTYTNVYAGIGFRSYESLKIAYFSQASQARFLGPFVKIEHATSPTLSFSLEYQYYNDAPRPLDRLEAIPTQFLTFWGAFKFNNGSLMSSYSRTSPFISVGIGSQVQEGQLSTHLGLGTGISFQLNRSISLLGKFVFQRFLDQRYSSFSPSIGLGYTIRTSKGPKTLKPHPAVEEESIMFAIDMDNDADGDGLPDRIDTCPEEVGTPQNRGCPDKPTISLQPEEPLITPLEQDTYSSIAATSSTRENLPPTEPQAAEVLKNPCTSSPENGELIFSEVFFPESPQLSEEGLEQIALLGAIMTSCERRHLKLEATYPRKGKLIRNLIMSRIYKIKYLLVNELNISQDRISVKTSPLTSSLSEDSRTSLEQISYKLNNMNN